MRILLQKQTLEVEIKKSRFIAHCLPICSPENAIELLNQVRDPSATHNCWAYRYGDQYRFSDDGEPGGSAGRPILSAIDGQGLDNVLSIVIRYFGGIKLGVGGLVRAYGNTVAQCLRAAATEEYHPMVALKVEVAFSDTYALYGILQQYQITKLSEDYAPNGLITTLQMRDSLLDTIKSALIDGTRGNIRFLD